MEYRIFLYISPFIIAAVLFLLFLCWKRREYSLANHLFLFVFVAFGYLVSNVSEFLVPNELWIITWTKTEHIFVSLVPVTWLFFIFEFTGNHEWQKPKRFWPFCIPSVVHLSLVFTNDLHHWFWKAIRFELIDHILVIRTSYGIPFYIIWFFLYGNMFLGVVLVIREYIRSHSVYRHQIFWLFLGITIAVTLNLIYVLRIFPWLRKDFTPLGYALGSMAFAVGIFKHQFLNVIPFPRTRLFDFLAEGIVVIDKTNRIADMNKTAMRILGVSAYKPGTSAYQYSLLVPIFEEAATMPGGTFRKDISAGAENHQSHYEVTLNKLNDSRKKHQGSVIVIHDITERIRLFEEIKTLRGIVPICAKCKKVRNDEGFWQQVEAYVSDHSYAEFSHGLCPSCMEELYPGLPPDTEEEGKNPHGT